MHHVMIHPSGYDTCRKAVDLAFELFPIQITQKKVLIKPNVLRVSEAKEHIVLAPLYCGRFLYHLLLLPGDLPRKSDVIKVRNDGFVKSHSAVLRFIFRHCSVPASTLHSSRFARLA